MPELRDGTGLREGVVAWLWRALWEDLSPVVRGCATRTGGWVRRRSIAGFRVAATLRGILPSVAGSASREMVCLALGSGMEGADRPRCD